MRRIRVPWFRNETASSAKETAQKEKAGQSPLRPSRVGGQTLFAAILASLVLSAPLASASMDSGKYTKHHEDLRAPSEKAASARVEALEKLHRIADDQRRLQSRVYDGWVKVLELRETAPLQTRLCAHEHLAGASSWLSFVETADRLAWEALAMDQYDRFGAELTNSLMGIEQTSRALERLQECANTRISEDGQALTFINEGLMEPIQVALEPVGR